MCDFFNLPCDGKLNLKQFYFRIRFEIYTNLKLTLEHKQDLKWTTGIRQMLELKMGKEQNYHFSQMENISRLLFFSVSKHAVIGQFSVPYFYCTVS